MIKKFLLLCIIILFVSICFAQNSISESWTNLRKYVSGDFEGPGSEWVDYELNHGIDTEGRRYRRFRLVPGTELRYKYYLQFNTEKIFEPDFPTSSNARQVIIVDQGNGKMILKDNWADTPSSPTNLSYIAGDGEIILSWEPPADNSRWDVIFGGGYNIYYDTGPNFTSWNRVNTSPITDTSPYTITGLNNDDTYFFTVVAYDAYSVDDGPLYSDYAPRITATPSLPTDVIVRFNSGGVHYDAVSIGHGVGDDWEEIALDKVGNSDFWQTSLPLKPNSLFAYKFIVENDTIGKRYEFDRNQKMNWTFVYPHKPNISSFQIAGGFNEWKRENLTLHKDGFWRKTLEVYPGVYEYKIIINNEWQIDPYNPFITDKGDDDENSIIAIDRMPTNSQMRELTVPFADSFVIISDWQDTPTVPSNFRSRSTDATTIHLSWNNYLIDIEKFVIEYTEADPSEPENWLILDEVSGSRNSYTHSNIIPHQNYYYRIFAVDYTGNKSEKNYAETKLTPPVNINIIVDARADADSVALAGSFNDWDWTNEMIQLPDGRWIDTVLVQLNAPYEYRISMNGIKEADAQYEFTYHDPTGNVDMVFVAGSMNDWIPTANIMRQTDTYTWKTWLRNIDQNSEYKLVIDGVWTPDPNFRPDINKVPFQNGNRRLFVSDTKPVEIDFSGYCEPPIISAVAIDDTTISVEIVAPEIGAEDRYLWNIYRSETSNKNYEKIASVSALDDITEYIDSGLTPDIRYYYRVTGVDTGVSYEWQLEGGFSNQVDVRSASPVYITFILDAGLASNRYESIFIGGNFNDWSDTLHQMTRDPGGRGIWSFTKRFPVDELLEYKFNIEGTTWERNRLTLIRQSFPDANTVYIAGTFNGWNPTATPMMREGESNFWYIELGLSRDDRYKFVIDGEWEEGPDRQLTDASPNRTLFVSQEDTIYHNWNDTPPKPVITLEAGENMIYVNWNSVDSDVLQDSYILFRSDSTPDNFRKIDFGNQFYRYRDMDVVRGKKYYYKILAIDSTKDALVSDTSDIVSIEPGFLGDAIFKLSAGENPFVEEISIVGEFNDWDPTANILSLSDSPGIWVGTVNNIIINKRYRFKYLYNRGFETYEPGDDRVEEIKLVNEHNWGGNPRPPKISAVPDDNKINIYIQTEDIDIKHYFLFRNGIFIKRIESNTFNTLFVDDDVRMNTEYSYYVESYDYGGLKSEESERVLVKAGTRANVKFVVDMRNEIHKGANTRFGVQIAGSPNPLTPNPAVNNLKERQSGVYEIDVNFFTNQNVNYYYAYNAGTRREVRERFEHTFQAPSEADDADSVLIAGDFNDWDINKAYVMKRRESDSKWVYTDNFAAGRYRYKFIIDSVWEDGEDRLLNLYRNFEVSAPSLTRYDVFNSGEESVPKPPKGLASIAYGQDSVVLYWFKNIEQSVVSYDVYRGRTKDNLSFRLNTSNSFFIDENVTPDSTYYYAVRAVNSAGTKSNRSTTEKVTVPTGNNVVVRRNERVSVKTDKSAFDDKNISAVQILLYDELEYFSAYDDKMSRYFRAIQNANDKVMSSNRVSFVDENNKNENLSLIKFIDDSGKEVHAFDTYITITKMINSLPAGSDTNNFKIFVLDIDRESWEILDNTLPDSDSLYVSRYKNSIYTVLQAEDSLTNLSGLVVWPNPLYYNNPNSRQMITFNNIPDDVEFLKIFTLTGEKVIEFNHSDFEYDGNDRKLDWDCRNRYGQTVASGIYLYYIQTRSGSGSGRLGIIR